MEHSLPPEAIKFIKECQKDVAFFIENCCKVKHPSAGVLPFKLFSYQRRILKDFVGNIYNIFKKCRQSGISTLTGAYALWYAMFFSYKSILIVSKRDEDAKDFIAKNVKFVIENLPEWMRKIWGVSDSDKGWSNEHTVKFRNGSVIKSLTSSKDTLRSNSASLVIIDEAGFMPSMTDMWCVSLDTLVATDNGLCQIKDIIGDRKQAKTVVNHNINVVTDDGLKESTSNWLNGVVDTKTITTELGYEITASYNHKFRIIDENGDYKWKKSEDINKGDMICLSPNTAIDSEDVVQREPDLCEFKNVEAIPSKILSSNRDCLASFIRGLFEADGTISVYGDAVKIGHSTDSKKLHDQLKTALLSLGIITRSHIRKRKNGFSDSIKYEQYVLDQHNINKFKQQIGFISERKKSKLKQQRSNNDGMLIRHHHLVNDFIEKAKKYVNEKDEKARLRYYKNVSRIKITKAQDLCNRFPELYDTKLGKLLKKGLIFDIIKTVKDSQCETGDITVPSNNTYIANGFVSHNTSGQPTLMHGGCISPESLISSKNGLVQVGSVHDNSEPWIDINLDVQTDEDFATATKAFDNGIVETRKITTSDGYYIEPSLEHRLRVIDEFGNYSWKYVRDIQVGDNVVLSDRPNDGGTIHKLDHDFYEIYEKECKLCGKEYDRELLRSLSKTDDGYCSSCMTSIRVLSKNTTPLPTYIDDQFAELLGLIWGDGFIQDNGRFGISCDRNYKDLIEHIDRLVNRLFGTKTKHEVTHKDHSLRFCNRRLYLLLKKNHLLKQKCHNLRVPEVIFSSNPDIRASFLRGLFEADGSISRCYVTLCMSSKDFARQIQTLLLSHGIRSRLMSTQRKDGLKYVLRLKTRRDVIRFRQHIGFISKKKRSKLEAVKDTGRTHNDRFTNNVAIREFHDVGIGLSSKIRNETRRCVRLGRISRKLVTSLCEKHKQLSTSALGFLATNNLFSDEVAHIESGFCHTYDLMVPDGNTYIANGFVNHNSVVCISTCVSGDTLVITGDGIKRIDEFNTEYHRYNKDYDMSDLDVDVATDAGLYCATKIFKRHTGSCLKLATSYGTNLTCHENHVIKIFNEGCMWQDAKNIHIDDYIAIASGANVWGNNDRLGFQDDFTIESIDHNFAYKLGIILAEGYINKDYVTIVSGDEEIRELFLSDSMMNWKSERDIHLRYCSRSFVRFLEWFGFKRVKAPHKCVPQRLLLCSKEIIASFLSGLFDGDGFSRTQDGSIGLVSTSKFIIDTVRTILLNFGIFSGLEEKPACLREFRLSDKKYTSRCRESYVLVLNGDNAKKFYKDIGFGLDRKQQNIINLKSSSYSLTPPIAKLIRKWMYRHGISISQLKHESSVSANKLLFHGSGRITKTVLRKILETYADCQCELYNDLLFAARDDVRFEKISKIEYAGELETFDLTVPKKHDFLTNGIVSHNCNGVGNWYYNTWTDAEQGKNKFNPIIINWWDMDWKIEFTDETGNEIKIAPTEGIRKSTEEEKSTYGPYWSPWLEEQYMALQEKGDSSKFRQEILAEFLGTGKTVVPQHILSYIVDNIEESDYKHKVVGDGCRYVNPVNGDRILLDFQDQLWIWNEPEENHKYVMGVDLSGGDGRDYSAIEVFDIMTREQVAELNIKILPKVFSFMVDYVGRWYNNAIVVLDRTGMGDPICKNIEHDLHYPNLWRDNRDRKKKAGKVGMAIGPTTKPMLNKFLIDNLGKEGYIIKSRRLAQQLTIYIKYGSGKTGNEKGIGNRDDCVLASALAFMGAPEAIYDNGVLAPIRNISSPTLKETPSKSVEETLEETIGKHVRNVLPPISVSVYDDSDRKTAAQNELSAFKNSLISSDTSPGTTKKKHTFNSKPKRSSGPLIIKKKKKKN